MEISKKELLFSNVTSGLIILFMAAGTAVALWLFLAILPLLGQMSNGSFYPVLAGGMGVLFYLGAMCIAINLLRMLHTLKGDPFVQANVTTLRVMGFTALGMMCATFPLFLIPVNVFLFVAVGLAVGMCGLLSLVLAQVFQRAVLYKQENDLTI